MTRVAFDDERLIDQAFIELAIIEAEKCSSEESTVAPKVGAVVVLDGVVLASAHRAENAPGAHAEFVALEQKLADRSLVGATLYTTVEPCTTRKAPTVPCAERVIARGIRSVVIGMLDPSPMLRGNGLLKLREAGLTVRLFPEAALTRIEALNRQFIVDLKPIEQVAALVQAIVTPVDRRPEGLLIQAVAPVWSMLVRLLGEDPAQAFAISPYKWEELVAAAFDVAGYDEVVLTPKSGDHGRDVIATRNGVGSVRIIGSVKAYKPGHLVRHDDVRALAGVLSADTSASKGIVTTTSDFAPGIRSDPFIKPLTPYRLELMNGTELQRWFEGLVRTRSGR